MQPSAVEADGFDVLDAAILLAQRWRLLLVAPLAAGILAVACSYLVKPTYTARTSFLPPQQQQSAAASALAALGSLTGQSGGAAKNPADQYVALLQSNRIADRLIEAFDLQAVYGKPLRSLTRETLAGNSRIAAGKKDGVVVIEVVDNDAERAARLANQYVVELQRLTADLALTEAQQRRVFYEAQLKKVRQNLTTAQTALQESGFDAGALKVEPKAAADTYAKLRAEATALEVRLRAMRSYLQDEATEVRQAQSALAAMRSQLERIEAAKSAAPTSADGNYVSRYREFKYQEVLFDMLSRQLELARLDESRDGALIQQLDVAEPPDRKSGPQRAKLGLTMTALAFVVLVLGLLARHQLARAQRLNPGLADRMRALRRAHRH